MSREDEVAISLEDTFEQSAKATPIETRSKNPDRLRKELSRKMNLEIHRIFEFMAPGIPVLRQYTINYNNSNDVLDASRNILRFSILPEDRLYTQEIAMARQDMEEFLAVLIKCCPDKNGLSLDARPSTFTYDLEYSPNSLIDALYNMVHEIMEPNQEVFSHIYLAGHILDRIEQYSPAAKLN